MVQDPSVTQGVSQQVEAFPAWLLPLWANWPLIVVGLMVVAIMLVFMVRTEPVLKRGLTSMAEKMDNLGYQVDIYRQNTLEGIQTLRQELNDMNQRVSSLEKIQEKSSK